MKFLFVVFFAIMYLAGMSILYIPVYGHASPTTYSPTPNQVIKSSKASPDKVTITFTERPEIRASSIKVIDQNNQRVDKNDLKNGDSDKSLTTSLDSSKITSGIYTVNWAVLSKDDGHITKGSYVFTIEDSKTKQNPSQTNQTNATQVSGFSKNITTSDNVVLNFKVSPAKPGQNTFSLGVHYINGTPVENIRNIFLQFTNAEKNLGPIADTMNRTGSGNYSLQGSYLSQDGEWQVKTTVQRINQYDINENFEVPITK
jgi:methionine-rich copper-binding protein CopC